MATAELPRPGVEVVQKFESAAPTILRPTLVPVVVGPAKEVVNALNTDGTINSSAKQGSYTQLPKTIAQTSFPSPRGNILQVNPEESTIRTFLSVGGFLQELPSSPGSAFLTSWNKASRACLEMLDPTAGSGYDVKNKTVVMCLDQPVTASTAKDVAITFTAAGAKATAAEVVAQINTAFNATIASIDGARVKVLSPTYGALSSITVRSGGTANVGLFGAGTDAKAQRIVGSGFRAQDQSNNTTVSPWIEWYRGAYLEDSGAGFVDTAFPVIGANTAYFSLVDSTGTLVQAKATALTFTGNSSIDLKIGDQFWADGAQPSGAVVMKVESARFKLGTLNSALSVFDAEGKVVSAVYDPVSIQISIGAAPFAPRFAWFKAENLSPTSSATAASVTGKATGLAALPGTTTGTSQAGPFNLAGLTLVFSVVQDGVALDDQTATFTGQLANMTAVANFLTALNLTGLLFTVTGGTQLVVSTATTGANQSVTIAASSTAATALGVTTGTLFAGQDVLMTVGPTLDTADSSANFPMGTLATKALIVEVSTDGGVTWPVGARVTHTFAAGAYTNMAAVLADLALDATFSAAITATDQGGGILRLQAVAARGTQAQIRIYNNASNNAVGVSLLKFTLGQTSSAGTGLAGEQLWFQLNERPHTYKLTFLTDSLWDAVALINSTVGTTVASIGGLSSNKLVLTSPLLGMGSSVTILTDSVTLNGRTAFGFNSSSPSNLTATGTGRPNPDFYLDGNGSVVLGGEILRSLVSGLPYDPGAADIYIQYQGLRLDVSSSASVPAILQLSDTTTLTSVLGPINASNPLGLGMFFAMVNAPGLLVTGIGVDEVTGAAPEGTLAGYSRAAGFLESQEVYAIAPLTSDEGVAAMFNAHAAFMSDSTQKGERIVLFNPKVPTRRVDNIIASGLAGNTTSTSNEFAADVNPAAALLAAGINPVLPMAASVNLFLTITVNGVERNYSVASTNGVMIEVRNTFGTTENTDGFFTTAPLVESLVNATWTLKVRGTPLLISGSSLPDKAAIAETVAAKGTAYANRRAYYVFPDTVSATLDGTDQELPGYYACAAIAGMIAHYPPQQGFTNLPMVGFNGVSGSQDFLSNAQLNGIAGGGVYILTQDAPGGPVISRHQLSTDMSSIETRELSITKLVDYVSKFLRTGLRRFIGTFNITQPFLDSLSTVIHGMLKFLEDAGVIISGDLNNLIQSKDQPDTVLVDVVLNVPYPCNYIRVKLLV